MESLYCAISARATTPDGDLQLDSRELTEATTYREESIPNLSDERPAGGVDKQERSDKRTRVRGGWGGAKRADRGKEMSRRDVERDFGVTVVVRLIPSLWEKQAGDQDQDQDRDHWDVRTRAERRGMRTRRDGGVVAVEATGLVVLRSGGSKVRGRFRTWELRGKP
ncbi:hypothetical protein BC567DRAFT_205062 [Phyllosticta citribraziliensis]